MNKNTKLCIPAILLLLCFIMYGKEISVDTLKTELNQSEDTQKAALLNQLSILVMDSDPKSSEMYAKEALLWSQKCKQKKEEAAALENLGLVCKFTSDYKQAFSYFEQAREIFSRLNDKEGLAGNFRLTGVVYRELNNYTKAMEYYQKSLDIQSKLGNMDQIGRTLNNMGNIYNDFSHFHEALDYYQRALEIFKDLKNDRAVAIILNNIAIIYKEFINSEKALEYCKQALEISRKINNKRIISLTYSNMGLLYSEIEQYSRSLNSYNKSLSLQNELNDREGTAVTLNDIGWVHQQLGEYGKALTYHLQSVDIFKEISEEFKLIAVYNNIGKAYLELDNYQQSQAYLEEARDLIKNSANVEKSAVWKNHRFSSELYEELGEYQKAHEFYKSYRELKDAVFTENTSKMIIEMERKYHTIQREKENERLKKEKSTLLFLFSGGFVLLIILCALFYIKYRLKLKEREMRERTTFFMNLAHEIKTPLTLIRSYFSRFTKDLERSDSLDLIQFNLDTLIRYILNFFTLEKLERGEILYDHLQIINLNTICEKITALTEPACAEKGISILYDGLNKDSYINIDPDALNTILYNLLQNAVKYTGKDGSIEVRLKESEKTIELMVGDTGIGIEAEDLDSVFKPFNRLLAHSGRIEGLGLGLSIVKNIVDQIGGRIEIKSKPGEGTRCYILFNKLSAPGGDIEETNIELSQVKVRRPREYQKIRHFKNKSTILIVDDEPDLLWALQDLFLEAGYNAYIAESGKDALEKLKIIPTPDVIVSDIMMDSMNGYVLFDFISNNPLLTTIPFVFLSARTADSEIIKGLELGAVEYIPKPFDNQKLVARVGAIVEYVKKKELLIRQESTKVAEEIKSLPINEQLCLKYGITPRHKDILRQKQQGFTYKEIGSTMGISEGTVKAHFSAIKEKTGINDINKIIKLFFYDYTSG